MSIEYLFQERDSLEKDGKGKKIAEIQSRKGRKAKNTGSRLYSDKHGNYITHPGVIQTDQPERLRVSPSQ